MKINLFRQNKNQAAVAKRQFIDVLSRYDKAAINGLITQWQTILGAEKLTHLIVNEVLVECNSDNYSWFCQMFLGQYHYEQMQRKAQNNIFQILASEGLQLGKDFSFGVDGEVIISDRAEQILLNQVPQQRRASFEAQLQTSLVPDAITAIEQQLGCPFFTNLTEITSRQIQMLSNSQAAAYLGVMLAGLVSRHPQLKDADFPTRFIFSTLDSLPQDRAMAILNDPETNPEFDETIIFQHLLAAMEDTEYHRVTDFDGFISLEQLKKLDLVWCGERRISEIIDMMEKWHSKNRYSKKHID